jgi:hypothetical protein
MVFGILDVTFVGQLFVIDAGDLDVDINAIQERTADLLLIAGDSYGGTAALFDGGVVEAAGEGAGVAVVSFI